MPRHERNASVADECRTLPCVKYAHLPGDFCRERTGPVLQSAPEIIIQELRQLLVVSELLQPPCQDRALAIHQIVRVESEEGKLLRRLDARSHDFGAEFLVRGLQPRLRKGNWQSARQIFAHLLANDFRVHGK